MSLAWQRFKQVTKYIPPDHQLYRASAPNYAGGTTQFLTEAAVQFLSDRGIDSIISFNEHPYNAAALQLLEDANVDYIHLRVVDFTAPTLDQLRNANEFFLQHKATLIHCGYGHGRTGTGVTALQLYATKGSAPVETDWNMENHVESIAQIKVLQNLRDSF
jgi:protein tyrosine phosphatase